MKRNYIKLVKDPKAKNITFETFVTPEFIPLRKVVEASALKKASKDSEADDMEIFVTMADFVSDIYNRQFTVDDILDRLHAPDAMEELQQQVEFIAQGHMSDERKKELAKMV